ncbi:MAG TPA: hypothetical protein ENI05_13165 [Porticoccus sp.]|nr:hypothetical protein [Porticoccus sp.]
MSRYPYCVLNINHSQRFILALLLLAFALPLRALEGFQYQGVVTQGAVATTDNDFYGDSTDGVSLDFTELSISVSQVLTPSLRVAAQAMYRHAGDGYEDLDLDYAMIDYQFFSNVDATAGLRLGRFKNPIGLYNDTRDVAFTRPGVFLPQSIYADDLREPFLSTDGLAFYSSIFTNSGEWTLEFGAGKLRLEAVTEAAEQEAQKSEGFALYEDDNEQVLVGRINYAHDGGRWQLALSYLQMKYDYSDTYREEVEPDFFEVFEETGTIENTHWILSWQYLWNSWTLSAEYDAENYMDEFTDIEGFVESDDKAYYLQITKQLSHRWSAFYRYDVRKFDDNPLFVFEGEVIDLSEEFDDEPAIPKWVDFQKDHTVGFRWDISSNMLLMAEYHYIDGIALLPFNDPSDISNNNRYWHMLAASFSYRF